MLDLSLIRKALKEDRAWNDVTAKLFIPRSARARAVILAQAPGVLAGGEAAAAAFRLLDRGLKIKLLCKDGRSLRHGQKILEATGSLRSLLSAERTALNTLTHLSGIATLTQRFVQNVAGTRAHILDTRKTLPGLRVWEKHAVLCGGGKNHRMDLADAILIKENHLAGLSTEKDWADFRKKVSQARPLRVEMECRNHAEIRQALAARVDILLLDNFSLPRLRRAVSFIKKACTQNGQGFPLVEVSGGVTLTRVRALAQTGVDRISVGCLTHSAPILNMHMDILPL